VTLYPLYHPAAALYTPAMLEILEEDFARLPELLGAPAPEPAVAAPLAVQEPLLAAASVAPAQEQLGLF
jgi:DNA polymerase